MLAEVERRLMSALLAGDLPALDVLRQQYAAACVEDRTVADSGLSLVTNFRMPPSVSRLPVRRLELPDVGFQLAGGAQGCFARLRVEDGVLALFHAMLWAGPWPVEARVERVYYLSRRQAPEGWAQSGVARHELAAAGGYICRMSEERDTA